MSGPRPSSVACPVGKCRAKVGRACYDDSGNTRSRAHAERRALAVEHAASEPGRRAAAAREAIATMRLGNAVVDALRAGVDERTIMLVVRSSLQVSNDKGPGR